MSITPNPDANYTPPMKGYSGQGAFRFWCQTVLPIVYDDSLSYYELLNKMVVYLNNTISDVAAMEDNVQALHDAYAELESYVNNYFNNLDVQAEINTKLDQMASSGALDSLLEPFVTAQLPDVVDAQIDEVVAAQIDNSVAGQIDSSVASQIAQPTATAVTAWLGEHVNPVGSAVVVDDTLTISGAAADAKVTGDRIENIEDFWLMSNNEVQTFYGLGNFQHYGLNTDGSFITNQKYRVSNNDAMTFSRDITIHVKSGFRWGYIPFVNNVAGSWVGWITSDYCIPSNTNFVVQIARVTEDTSEIADVSEFLSAVTFSTSSQDLLDVLKNDDIQIKSELISIDGKILAPEYAIGIRTVSNDKDVWANMTSRLTFARWKYIELKKDDVVSCDTNVIGAFGGGYSTNGGASFVGITSHTTYTAPADGIYFFWLRKADNTDFSSADVANAWKYLTFTRDGSDIANINAQLESIASDVSSLQESVELNNNLLTDVTWEQGAITESGDLNATNKLRTKEYLNILTTLTVTLWCDSGYKYYYLLYNAQKTFLSAISNTTAQKTIDVTSTDAKYVRIVLSRTDDGNISTSEGQYMHGLLSSALLDIPVNMEKISNRVNVVENLFRFKPYFSHIGVSQTTNIIIPSQSVADVMRTKRLGFDVLELNVQKTNDNKYVCLHGSGGKFGAQFIGADSSDVSDIKVSDKTLNWIKTNVRYVSQYAKYQTSPYTLEEMLLECKKLGVIPLVQYVDTDMVAIANQLMGKDNYILNLYENDRGLITDAVCASWTAIANEADAVAKCKASGQNYILGVDYGNSAFSEFDDDDWSSYIDAIHEAGFTICGAYINAQIWQKLYNMGWDILASGAQINEIEHGNLCNLYSDTSFADFTTAGTVSSGVLSLTAGQTITPSTTIPSVFLGGGSLHIRFSGKIYVNLGKVVTSYTSDGTSDVWVSSYFEEAAPTFTIEADQNVNVYDLSYKASRM